MFKIKGDLIRITKKLVFAFLSVSIVRKALRLMLIKYPRFEGIFFNLIDRFPTYYKINNRLYDRYKAVTLDSPGVLVKKTLRAKIEMNGCK